MSTPISTTSTTEGQSIPTCKFKPLVSLLKHKWLTLFIILIVSMTGFLMLSKKEKPVYSTTAVLLVSPKFTPNLDSERGMDLQRTEYQLYIKQQVNLITRSDVLQEALQMPKVRDNWLLPGEILNLGKIRLKQAISVKDKRGSPFMTITLIGNKAKGLDIVLNSLIDIYLKKSQAENIYDSSGRIERLGQRKSELERLISKNRERRTQIALKLGVTTFQENSSNPYDNILIETMQAHTLARRQRVEAETRLAILIKKQSGSQTMLDILVNEMLANDSVLRSFKTKLTDRRTELLTQMLGLTPKHPNRRRAEKEMAKIDRDIEQATNKLFKEIHNRLLEKAKAEIYQTQGIEQVLAAELKAQRQQANHYATLYNKALLLSQEMNRSERLLEKIYSRIDFLNTEASAPGFVRLNTSAKQPSSPNKSKQQVIVLMFIVVALGLGIGIPILIDMLDRRIHTPGEIHKMLGFPPIAWILERCDLNTEQFANDYLRRMALALERDWHSHKTTTFVLTSVKPGGGTTTLILELAHLLSELGVRTLAMELNAFKPDDRYKGASPYNSLTTLLSKDSHISSPEALVIPATTDLPDRLPIGETPKHYITTYGKLRPVIEQLNTHYDLILLDTPPLLLSSDAELLGKIVGGVLLVVEAGAITPGELKRAAQLLERLNPPVVGSVLNRVKVFRGGGYFAKLLKEYEQGSKIRPGWIKRFLWH